MALWPPDGKLGKGSIPRIIRVLGVKHASQRHEDIRGAGETMHWVVANGVAVLAQIGITEWKVLPGI
jgi:hypothetical protein